MKYIKNSFWRIGFAGLILSSVVEASITVESTVLGASVSALDLNIGIDAGLASSESTNFNVSGAVTTTTAFGRTIHLTLDAMKNVSTNASTRGDKLVDGTLNGSLAGLGVSSDPNTGGIGCDSVSREGIQVAFTDLSSLNSSLTVQITFINVQNVFNSGESFFVVNSATRDFVEFSSGASGNFDVSGLGLTMTGGTSGPIAAIYSGDTGGFRVMGMTLEVNDGGNNLMVGNLDFVHSPRDKASIAVNALISEENLSSMDLEINIDSGTVSSTNTNFDVAEFSPGTGSAFSGTIGLIFDAAKNVSTNAEIRGDKLTDGTISSDSSSLLGVGGDPNGAGIGADTTNREGVIISLDNQLAGSYEATVQVNEINIQNVFNAGESFVVVNPVTRDFLEFRSGSPGNFDVSSLGLSMEGGASGEVAVIYSGDTGGFRVKGVTLDLVHPEGVVVAGEATAGGVYTLQKTTNLLSGTWIDQSVAVEDSEGHASFETTAEATQSFYRVVTAGGFNRSPVGMHMGTDWGYKTELHDLDPGFIRLSIKTLGGLSKPDFIQMLKDNKSRIICLTLFNLQDDDIDTTINILSKLIRRYPNIRYIQTDNESDLFVKWPETEEEYDEYAALHALVYDRLKTKFPGIQVSASFSSLLPETAKAIRRCNMAFTSFSKYAPGKVDSIDFHYHHFWNEAEGIGGEFSGAQNYLLTYPAMGNAHFIVTENSTWSGDPEKPEYQEVQPQTTEEQAIYYFQTGILALAHGAHHIVMGRLYDRESYNGLPMHPSALNGLFYLDGKEYPDGPHSGPKPAAFTARLLIYLTAGLLPGHAELRKTGNVYDVQFTGPRPFRAVWFADGATLNASEETYRVNGKNGEEYTILTPIPSESAVWPLSDVPSGFPQQTVTCTDGTIELLLKNRLPLVLIESKYL
ncbi:MAG: hypothetical protein AB7E95_01570 [Kiritimatiellales bacterium]